MVVVPEIAAQVPAEIADRAKPLPVNHVGLERVEERLHMGILVGGPSARHALAYPMLRQTVSEGAAEELAAAIAVEDQARGRSSPPERGVHRRTCKTRVASRSEPPGEHAPRVLVEDRHQIPPATTDRDVGHVSDPDLIRTAGLGASHAVRVPAEPSMRSRLGPVDAREAGSPSSDAHESLHPPAT